MLLGSSSFDVLLLPLAQHLPLEAGDRVQQLVSSHLGGRQHDAEVQEAVDGVQQVLPVVCQVGRLVEVLVGTMEEEGESGGELLGSHWAHTWSLGLSAATTSVEATKNDACFKIS